MKDGAFNVSALALNLKCCAQTKSLSEGLRLHQLIRTHGYDTHTFLGNWIVQMYGDCERPFAAQEAFDKIISPNLYSWNILINALGQNGRLQDAVTAFNRMPTRDVVSWNAIISAHAQHGLSFDALRLFSEMRANDVMPTSISYVSALSAASSVAAIREGEEIFAEIARTQHWNNVIVGNAVIDMYSKSGRIDEAHVVFQKMPNHNVISWTTIIAAYTHNKQAEKALKLFNVMLSNGFTPESITYGIVIDACSGTSAFVEGQDIHFSAVCSGHEQDTMVGSALINLYAKFGCLCEASHSFCKILNQNVVSWTSIVSAHVENECFWQGLLIYYDMVLSGIKPDRVTFISVIETCVNLGVIDHGKMTHHTILDCGCEDVLEVGNGLIDMYGKCGSMNDAKRVFDRMPIHDIVSWNAMIATSAHNGNDDEAFAYLWKMHHAGLEPNAITFVSALTACSHGGFVDSGRKVFLHMHIENNLMPTVDQSACMIDLFGRAGCLEEAEALIYSIPFDKASAAWISLLSACRLHGDVERGVRLAQFCFELDRKNIAAYKVLSNMLR